MTLIADRLSMLLGNLLRLIATTVEDGIRVVRYARTVSRNSSRMQLTFDFRHSLICLSGYFSGRTV